MKMPKKSRYNIQTGDRFGRWTVIGPSVSINGKKHYLCQCDCGKTDYVYKYNLTQGFTKSCGCGYKMVSSLETKEEKAKERRIYGIWGNMLARCYDDKIPKYKNYGARGIAVCDEWKDNFLAFYEWSLANGYENDLTIDRIDVNGNYCPENCRWADWETQMNNTTKSHFITFNGKTQTLTQWARELGIDPKALFDRIYRGWSIERALTEPIYAPHSHKKKRVAAV